MYFVYEMTYTRCQVLTEAIFEPKFHMRASRNDVACVRREGIECRGAGNNSANSGQCGSIEAW